VTNRRGGDVLQGVLPHGTTDGRVFVAVVDGGEDAPMSGWDDPDPTTRYDTVANTVVAWHDPAPAGLTALVHCLRDEQKDA
jgi:hypothetical protein